MTSAHVHPATWWLWALAMAVVAAMVSNPVLLVIEAAVLYLVVVVAEPDPQLRRPMRMFVLFGLWAIAIRVVIGMAFGLRAPGVVLFSLPSLALPSWAAGVTIGGPVTIGLVMSSLVAGLRLAVIVCAFGAANTLASPHKLLRCLPGFLSEFGVAMGVALLFAPELVRSVSDLRSARRLRGRPTKGIAGLRGMVIPALEGALDRAVHLAASMDARGFGKVDRSESLHHQRRITLAAGAVSIAVGGVFVMFAGIGPSGLGLALGVSGVLGALVLLRRSDRSTARTRYHQQVFAPLDGAIVASGGLAVSCIVIVSHLDPSSIGFARSPMTWPALPVLAVVGLISGALPAVLLTLRRRSEATVVVMSS